MLAIKDPAIKLFGRKIPLPDDPGAPAIYADDVGASEKVDVQYGEPGKDTSLGKASDIKLPEDEDEDDDDEEDDDVAFDEDGSRNLEIGQEACVNPKTPSIDEETVKPSNGKSVNEESEATNSAKTLKKPDKLLPCPRCKSMDTKFCYYNNYNVNQPRHFCKACQRYWTAGGTMRNVPVGAGRRKSKNSATYYRHITVSEALEAARMEVSSGTHHHQPKFISNGRVLSFNVDAPKRDPLASVINLAEKKEVNGLKKSEEKGSLANHNTGETGETGDNGSLILSSIAVQSSTDIESGGGKKCPQEPHVQKFNGFPSHIPYLPGVPWHCVWNSSIPPPNFFPPGLPLSFYPAAAWNCGAPGPWTTPWFSPQPQKSSPNESLCPDSKSSTLGKHSRSDDDLAKEEPIKHRNGSVLVPKTLRIDDPREAAKSSIWATLGIKNESARGGSLFRGFQPKVQEKVHVAATSPVLQANPAALSRSLVFHESSSSVSCRYMKL